MRLWSIHPCYLDTKGLVALWREGLLAQHVLLGKTKGYKHHPQLIRFKKMSDCSINAIANYLESIVDEADRRGYSFNRAKITKANQNKKISVTNGQIEYEFKHLLAKLKVRDPVLYEQFKLVEKIKLHPIFKKVSGDIENWEVIR